MSSKINKYKYLKIFWQIVFIAAMCYMGILFNSTYEAYDIHAEFADGNKEDIRELKYLIANNNFTQNTAEQEKAEELLMLMESRQMYLERFPDSIYYDLWLLVACVCGMFISAKFEGKAEEKEKKLIVENRNYA